MVITLVIIGGLLVAAVIGLSVATVYNRLVKLNNLCDNSFAQIEVQLKRRYDLIPNLVECVRGYMQHEQETLENVIKARNQASAGLAELAKNTSSGAAIKSFAGAEGLLSNALGRLSVVMEAYPELKANENVAVMTEELTSTENRIGFARQSFNDWCTEFNVYRQSFPTILFAASIGYGDDRDLLEFEDSAAIQHAPAVSLTS
ncbi:MAG: LemA family protein [Planctomycetales bacterium]|nr:LemA family protein [Planctomycetales bacterium]